MSHDTFSKLIKLIPLAEDGGFLFSCLFEPTIHPNFVPFLQQIPALGRKKVFFTTNLARRLPRETFHQLSQVNISHINVSLDSLNPLVYEDLRRGAKFGTFIDNLENLVSVFGSYPTAPHIRFISMVFKQNLNELVDLVSVCHERYLAEVHELRTPFRDSLSHMDKEWVERSTVSEQEWNELVAVLSKRNLPTRFVGPTATQGNATLSSYEVPEIPNLYTRFPKLSIRVSSDGTVFLPWKRDVYYTYNINEMADPYGILKRKLYRVYDSATWPRWAHAFRCYTRVLLGS